MFSPFRVRVAFYEVIEKINKDCEDVFYKQDEEVSNEIANLSEVATTVTNLANGLFGRIKGWFLLKRR